MSINYYKMGYQDPSKGGAKRLYAINEGVTREDNDGFVGHPIAYMDFDVTSRRYIPNFASSPDDYKEHAYGYVAKQLGVHPDYARHVHQFGEDEDVAQMMQSVNRGETTNPTQFKQHLDLLRGARNVDTNEPFFQPDKLFTEIPPKVKISGMWSDPSMTSSAITMGALAMNMHGTDKVIPDAQLSEHSSRLARHAKNLGVIEQNWENPDMEQSWENEHNPMVIDPADLEQRSPGDYDIHGMRAQPVPPHEVAQARQTVRQILRGNRPAPAPKKNLSPQFDHPKLPGLEDF